MNRWLDTFAFRIEIHPGILAGSCALVVLVAATVISLLSLRASQRNPVTVLNQV